MNSPRDSQVLSAQQLQEELRFRDLTITEMQQSLAEYQELFDLAAIGIAQLDSRGRFIRVNSKFCEMLGYSNEELLGLSFLDVTHPADRDLDQNSIFPLLSFCTTVNEDGNTPPAKLLVSQTSIPLTNVSEASPTVEKRYIRKDGSTLWASIRTTLIKNSAGEPVSAVRAALDLTGRRELESQLAESAEAERQRLGRELHDTLGQQVTAIGLIATKLYEQLIADQQSRPHAEQAELLLETIEVAQQQVRLLFSRLLPIELDSQGLIFALAELVQKTEALHQVDCRLECDDPFEINDNITATHLYRIAQEAMHNAIKHGDAQSIVVRLTNQDGLLLQIHDDGRGITLDPKMVSAGTIGYPAGNGLSIMRYRASLIGGQLTVRPAQPRGSIIECQLPPISI